MAAVCVSGTVTNDSQRTYVEIETLREKTPTEIHISLMEVCGVETVDRSTISCWAQDFLEGRLSIENNPKSGQPRTTTDDQSVERVLQKLQEYRRMTCEETAHSAGISRASAYHILTERLHKRRIATRWVPHDLSVDVWKLHNNCCTDFVNKGTNFCNRWLLLMKLGSEISSLNCNLSPVSGEVKVPRD